MTLQVGYRYSGGALQVGYWVAGAPALPTITSVSTLQDGLALTITGADFSPSGNTPYVNGVPVAIVTEGTNSIVTSAFSAKNVPLTSTVEIYVVDGSGNESNRMTMQCQLLTGQIAFAVTAAFLGNAAYRPSSNPDLERGNEIKFRNVTGTNVTTANVNLDGSAGMDVSRNATSSVSTVEVDVYDGIEWSDQWATITWTGISVSTTLVPDVSGLTESAATAQIIAAGLEAVVVLSVYSESVAVGSVVGQFPAAGATVALNSTVELTVSLGPAPITVPDLVGLTVAAATTALTALGLVLGVQRNYIDGINSGLVLGQTYAAGTVVASGTTVDVTVSSNLTPDVVGLPQLDAVNEITDANLVVAEVTDFQYSSTVARDYVIAQSPEAGTEIDALGVVTLTVSLGAEQLIPSTSNFRPTTTLREFLLSQ